MKITQRLGRAFAALAFAVGFSSAAMADTTHTWSDNFTEPVSNKSITYTASGGETIYDKRQRGYAFQASFASGSTASAQIFKGTGGSNTITVGTDADGKVYLTVYASGKNPATKTVTTENAVITGPCVHTFVMLIRRGLSGENQKRCVRLYMDGSLLLEQVQLNGEDAEKFAGGPMTTAEFGDSTKTGNLYTGHITSTELSPASVDDDYDTLTTLLADAATFYPTTWGNAGSSFGGLSTENNGAFERQDWTVNFSANDGVINTGIGNQGKVRITKIRIMQRSTKASKRTTVTLTQGGKTVNGTVTSYDDETGMSLYKTDRTVAKTFAYHEATFTSEETFDPTQNIKIDFGGKLGCWVTKPHNSVMNHNSTWAPVIEISAVYTPVFGTTYAATVSSDKDFSAITWEPTLPGTLTANDKLVLTAQNNPTITFAAPYATPAQLTINGAAKIAAPDSFYDDLDLVHKVLGSFGKITADNLTYADVKSGYKGAYVKTAKELILHAQTKEIISLNIAGGNNQAGTSPTEYQVTGTDYCGLAPVQGSTWVNLTEKWGGGNATKNFPAIVATDDGSTAVAKSGMSATGAAYNTYHWATATDAFLKGYLDDGGNHAQVTVNGIPYARYDVIIYAATDSASGGKFTAPTVNGTAYTCGSDGVAYAGDATWGTAKQTAAAFGVNAMIVKNLSGATLAIVGGANSGGNRGGIAAVQIVEADAPAEPRFAINFNVSQGAGGAYNTDMGVLTAAANTAIGEIPLAAWKQSTTYEYGGQTLSQGSVAYSNLAAYDLTGKTNAATTAGLKVRCVQATNISANNDWSSAYKILNANLSMKSGDVSTATYSDGYLTFTGIPFGEYEVYVYFSRSTPNTDGSALFQALSVKTNDQAAVWYKGENGATVAAAGQDDRWGDPTVREELVEGANYLHVTGLRGAKLELFTEGEKYCGMAAVQIVGTFPVVPPTPKTAEEILAKAYLWLDASDADTITTDDNGLVTKWTTRSTSGNYAESYASGQVTAGPAVKANGLDGKSVVDFGSVGSGKDLRFTQTSNIRAVFMMADIDADSNAFILGDADLYHFHRNGSNFFADNASSKLKEGQIRRNGEAKAYNTPIGTGYGLITLIPTAGVQASRICRDRNVTEPRHGGKRVAELAIFTDAITDAERDIVEAYLMDKWNPPESRNMMYFNRLGGDDYSVMVDAGTYGGKITVPSGGYCATHFTERTKLDGSAALPERGGSYAAIIGTGVDLKTHTVAGWFKVDALPTAAGDGNARDLYLARSHDGDHGGYKVAVDKDGKILVGKINNVGWNTEDGSSVFKSAETVVSSDWFHLGVSVTKSETERKAVPRVFVNGTEITMTSTSGYFKTNLNGANCSGFEIGGGVSAAGLYVDSAAFEKGTTFAGLATDTTYVSFPPYVATIGGDTAWGNLTWYRKKVEVQLPADLSGCPLTIEGTGKVTGCAQSPASLIIGEHVLFDASAIYKSETQFSGDGVFLVDATAITVAHTFDTGARWGVVGSDDAANPAVVSAALTVKCVPFYSYGHVKLDDATFAVGHLTSSTLYIYDVKVMTGNLILGKSTLSARGYCVEAGAKITLDSATEITISNSNMMQGSGRAGGFYGQGTFAVADGRTVTGGYLGIATKYAYSGDANGFRCQYVWADHGHVGRDATLKFFTMSNTLDGYLVDMLKRFTVDNGGKIELYKHGNPATKYATFASTADNTPFSTDRLFGEPATTRDFDTQGARTMGYEGLYTNATRIANFGYDTSFISALVDEAHAEVTNAVPAEPYSVSLYADLTAFTNTNVMTIGDAATKAIRLRVGAGMLQIVEVTGETIRETGIIAARGIGFHLFTITKTDKGVALYVDGQLAGTDFAFTSTVSGPVTIGVGVSVRMFRIDEVQLSSGLVQALAARWPVNETTTPQVQSNDSILNQIRMRSEWAAQHLPESSKFLYNHDKIKADDPITGKTEERRQYLELYTNELCQVGLNGLPLWQSYLQGLDPNDPDKTHARPYINEVRFEEGKINHMETNTVVELSYANPERNSGINVTYHLASRDAVGNVHRNVPVLGTSAMIVDGLKAQNYTPKCEMQPKKPNIIFVLADDLGYGDVGWTVQNARKATGTQRYISTPHMDQMVAEGCQLTAHYAAAPVCAPSRASILTGKHQGTCSLRDNSFDCPILEERTIGTVMREQGYVTHAIGKWGVGGGGESGLPMIAHPLDRGFDHFYGFLDHGAGHTYYHYDGLLNGAYMGIMEDRERKTETAVGLYSTDLLMARAKKVLIDQVRENQEKGTDKPVFMYLAINAMHGSGGDKLDASVPNKVNLHVPGRAYPDANPATEKKFGVGEGLDWDWLQANREPINDRNTWLYDYTKDSKYSNPQARYATTVTRLDDAMEDLKQTIKDLGIEDNTIIIFTSDNGPTNEYGTNVDYFDSNGQFQGMKRSCMEGGLREPTFIWAPGYIKPGTVDNRPSMNHSWLQFCEEVAKSNTAPEMNDEVYCEYLYSNSQIMTRIGNYVGVNTKVTSCTLDTIPLNIYDVVNDPGQTTNLKDTEIGQALLPRMRELMKGYHTLWQRPSGFGNGDGGKESGGRPYDNK